MTIKQALYKQKRIKTQIENLKSYIYDSKKMINSLKYELDWLKRKTKELKK